MCCSDTLNVLANEPIVIKVHRKRRQIWSKLRESQTGSGNKLADWARTCGKWTARNQRGSPSKCERQVWRVQGKGRNAPLDKTGPDRRQHCTLPPVGAIMCTMQRNNGRPAEAAPMNWNQGESCVRVYRAAPQFDSGQR